MQYRTLGRTGLKVSTIGLGAMEIGREKGLPIVYSFKRPDEEQVIRFLHQVLDLGINFIDTAPAYQLSEERIGKALKVKRDKYILATKCGELYDDEKGSQYDFSFSATEAFIDRSLSKLQTDYIDLLQIHCNHLDLEIVERGETLEAMKKAQAAGKIRFIGISPNTTEGAMAAVNSGSYDTIQITYNMIHREMESEVIPAAIQNNIGIIIRGGLGYGRFSPAAKDSLTSEEKEIIENLHSLLSPEYPSLINLAIRFLLSNKDISLLLIGTRSIDHLEYNCRTSEQIPLSLGVIEKINSIVKVN